MESSVFEYFICNLAQITTNSLFKGSLSIDLSRHELICINHIFINLLAYSYRDQLSVTTSQGDHILWVHVSVVGFLED